MKKVFSLVLFMILTLALSVTAFAADSDIIASGYCGGEGDGTNLEWVLTEDGTLTISGEGKMECYKSTNNGKQITSAPWGEYSDHLKTLVIEEGVTNIGCCAFAFCSGFEGTLVIPNSVTIIEDSAFVLCSGFTGNLVIPNNVTEIGWYAFDKCDGFNGKLIIGKGITNIGDRAFYGCSKLTGDLFIHNNEISIGSLAFCNCGINNYYFGGDAPEMVRTPGESIMYDHFDKTDDTIYYPSGNSTWKVSGGKWNGYNTVGIIDSGYCGGEGDGTNVAWTLAEDGTFTISGEGKMADYRSHYTQEFGFITTAPWWIYADQVKLIVIEENITYFGAYALDNFGGIAVVKGQPYFGEKSLYMQDGLPSVYFFAGPPAGAHETAYNSVYKMYYLEETEYQWDMESGFWQGHRMYPYTIPNEVELDPADFTYSGYCGTDPFVCGKEIAWGYNAGSKTLTVMGTGNMQNYEPGYVDAPWYPYHEDVEKIVIDEGIIEIGDYSFYKFSNIKEITIPSTAVKIGKGVFFDAKISEGFEITENIETAGEYAFSGFSAPWLYIPQKTSFAYSAFYKNKIGEFRVSEDSWSYSVNDGVLMSKNERELIGFPGTRTGEYSVSEKVESIREYSFAASDIDKVIIPKNVKYIRFNAFTECAGKFIFEGAPEIGEKSFSSCLNSTVSIYFMNGEPSRTYPSFIDEKTNKGEVNLYYLEGTEDLWTFDENGLWREYEVKPFTAYEEVELDPSLYVASGYCGADQFTDGKNLAWGIDKNGVLTIFGKGEMADYSSSNGKTTAPWGAYSDKITTLVTEEGVAKIGNYAFYSLQSVNGKIIIPKSVVEIGEYAFCGSRFDTDLFIPGNVKTIGAAAFANIFGKKGDLIVCEGVESIEESAFHAGFTSAVFPSTLSNIGGELFGWQSVDNGNIVISENNPYYSIDKEILFNKNKTEIITCLKFNYGTKYAIPETVEIISNNAFKGTVFDKIIIPESVKEIKNMAFHVFRGDIIIKGKIEKIEDYAISPWDNATVCVYFMNGEPDSAATTAFRSKDGILNIYYLSGTEDLWDFDENGLWNGYEVNEYNGYGDLNMDFEIDVKDVHLARLIASKLIVPTDEQISIGDVDGNGRTNVIDANLIRKFCANIIAKFPIEG